MLEIGATGSFRDLSNLENIDNLVLVFMPGLEALYLRAEELNGSSLSEEQKNSIKMASQVIAMPEDIAIQTIEERGYE